MAGDGEAGKARRARKRLLFWLRYLTSKPRWLGLAGGLAVAVGFLWEHLSEAASAQRLEDLLKKKDLGDFPIITTAWLSWAKFNYELWYLSVGLVLGLYLFQARVSRLRMAAFVAALLIVITLEWFVYILANLVPLIPIKEPMGSAGH